MAIIVVPEVVQVAAIGTVSGRPWASVWHIANGAGWWSPGADVAEVARDFANNWQDHIVPGLCSTVTVTGFSYLSLNSVDGQRGTLAPDGAKPRVGGDASAALPPNCCYLVRKNTPALRGQRSGRAYLPGVPEAAVDGGGGLNSSVITNLNARLTDFRNGLTNDPNVDAHTRFLVVPHLPAAARQKGTHIVTGTATEVLSVTTDPLLATQRRRLRG